MSPLDQISGDLGWRERELASLKIVLSRRDISAAQRGTLLRAAWAMLYAHYEGFVKTVLTIFYEEAARRATACERLPRSTRARALAPAIAKIRSLPADDLLDHVETFAARYYRTAPSFPDVDTNSNLWPEVLIGLLKEADIEIDAVETHRHRLKTLVSRRNQIAHGNRNMIGEESYYNEFETAVLDLMYELAFRVDERLNSPPYAGHLSANSPP